MTDAEFADVLRGFAERARDIRFRGAERLLEDLDELGRDMRVRAAELTRRPADPPAERGTLADGLVETAKGGVVPVVFRGRRRRPAFKGWEA